MGLWWLEPGWKDATCPRCGVNIWDNGGDPDWGECYGCRASRYEQQRTYEEERPSCDICGKHEAVTGDWNEESSHKTMRKAGFTNAEVMKIVDGLP